MFQFVMKHPRKLLLNFVLDLVMWFAWVLCWVLVGKDYHWVFYGFVPIPHLCAIAAWLVPRTFRWGIMFDANEPTRAVMVASMMIVTIVAFLPLVF